MASSEFTVNGSSLPAAISTTWGATVTCSLVSTQRVNSVAWSVLGKSRSTLTTPTLVSSGSPSGAIMTFTFPSAGAYGAYGGSLLIQCVVTYSVAGKARTHTTRAMIGVPIPGTALVPGAIGETTERGTYGWLDLLNNQLAALSGLVVAGTSSDVAITGGGGATTLYDYPVAPVDRSRPTNRGLAGVQQRRHSDHPHDGLCAREDRWIDHPECPRHRADGARDSHGGRVGGVQHHGQHDIANVLHQHRDQHESVGIGGSSGGQDAELA
jgi:hypothetical protein